MTQTPPSQDTDTRAATAGASEGEWQPRGARPRRVLLATDAVGGVWDFSLSLAAGLRARGVDVLLAVVGPPPDAARRAAAHAVSGLVVEELAGRLEWMEGGLDWLDTLREAAAHLAARWRAEVVHVNQLGLAALGSHLCAHGVTQTPVVLGVHSDLATWWRWVKDSGGDDGTFPEYLQEQRTLARRALAAADVVVCPSEFLASEIARAYGLPEAPRVIHNAVSPLSPPELRVEREADLAAVVGRAWDEAKNLQVVAAALPRCRSAWRVDVAGDLAEPGREASPAATAPGLSYLGFLKKPLLSRLFHRASVFIAPSSYEPFGLAAAEAALAGCAVVANDLPSYREVWGDAAAYFQRNDPTALAEVLDGLAAQPARVTHLAAAARERVLARYTADRMVEQYLRVYAQAGQAGEAGAPVPSQAPPAARVAVQPHPQLHPGGF